jgi:hypothetical protein
MPELVQCQTCGILVHPDRVLHALHATCQVCRATLACTPVYCDCCGNVQLAVRHGNRLAIDRMRHGKVHYTVVALDKISEPGYTRLETKTNL